MGSGPLALVGVARALAPLATLLALLVVARAAPGAGLAGGALLSLIAVLHVVIFGAGAFGRTFTPFGWNLLAVISALAIVLSVIAPDWRHSAALGEAGVAGAGFSAFGLAFGAFATRAPSLRHEEW